MKTKKRAEQVYGISKEDGRALIPVIDGDDYDVWYGKDLKEYFELIGDDSPEAQAVGKKALYKVMNNESKYVIKLTESGTIIRDFFFNNFADDESRDMLIFEQFRMWQQLTDNEIKKIIRWLHNFKVGA